MCQVRRQHVSPRGLLLHPFLVLLFAIHPFSASLLAQSPDALLDSARSLLMFDPGKADTVAKRALSLAINSVQQANALYISGIALQKKGKNFDAAEVLRKGLISARKISNSKLQAMLLGELGRTNLRMGFFDQSLNEHLQALSLFDSLQDKCGTAKAMFDIGVTLRNLHRYDEARYYHDRALEIRTAENDVSGIAASLTGIGNLFWYSGSLDSAETYYRKALELERQIDMLSENIAGYLNNLANIYRERALYHKALTTYEESLHVSSLTGNTNMRAITLKNLGVLFLRSGDLNAAKERLKEAASLAYANGMARVYLESMDALPLVYEQMGDLHSALRAREDAGAAKDSLFNLLNKDKLANVELLYQTEKHQRTLRELEAERQKFVVRFLVVSALLLCVLVIGVFLWLHSIRKRNRDLSEKSEHIKTTHSELQLLHEKVVRSEEQYRHLFEGLPVGVFFYDHTLHILQANEALAEILGIADEQVIGYDLYKLRSTDVLETLEDGLTDNHCIYEGFLTVPATGEPMMVSLRTAPMRADGGRKKAIGFVIDISDWKQIEQELLGAKEAADEAVRLKQAFLISISHEIRTPLNVIMGYVGVLRALRIERASYEEKEYFEKISIAVRRLTRTVDQLLNLAVLESGGYAFEPELIDMSALTGQLVEETRSIAEDKQLPVVFRPADRNIYIRADKYSVTEALRNILDNAVKFTDEGEISVTLTSRSPDVVLSIADTGIGISEAYLRQLYVAFTQENIGYSRPYDGLGLGLTLAKRYVDANNGGITARSTKGIGSTFTIAFVEAAAPSESPDQQTEISEPVAVTAPANVTLLVVEDDKETQKFLNLVLADEFRIHFADCALDAWEILHKHRIDVVLMDISIKGDEDGLSLTRRIRTDPAIAKTPVIAVTAHAFTEDKRRSFEAGCDDYLTKPFRTQQLRERIRRQFTRIVSQT